MRVEQFYYVDYVIRKMHIMRAIGSRIPHRRRTAIVSWLYLPWTDAVLQTRGARRALHDGTDILTTWHRIDHVIGG